MTPRIEAWLLRRAFGPTSQRRVPRILRRVARAILRVERNPGLHRGKYSATIVPRQARKIVKPDLAPKSIRFVPVMRDSSFAGDHGLRAGDVLIHPHATPEERPSDPEIERCLEEVTEPYILWDAPKSRYHFSTDYCYDYAEPVPQVHVPRYVRAIERTRRPIEDARAQAFSDLWNDRQLFTLSPEAVRLHRARRRDQS